MIKLKKPSRKDSEETKRWKKKKKKPGQRAIRGQVQEVNHLNDMFQEYKLEKMEGKISTTESLKKSQNLRT